MLDMYGFIVIDDNLDRNMLGGLFNRILIL